MKAILTVRAANKGFEPNLAIGVQSFMFGRWCETEDEANWYCKMMQTALDNLSKPDLCEECYENPKSGDEAYCTKCIEDYLTDL